MPRIKIATPMGEVSIPYNEEAVLDLIRKANKTNSNNIPRMTINKGI